MSGLLRWRGSLGDGARSAEMAGMGRHLEMARRSAANGATRHAGSTMDGFQKEV